METKLGNNSNFMEIAAATILAEVKAEKLPPYLKYLIVKDDHKIIKVLPVSSLYRALLTEKNTQKLTVADLDNSLSFSSLTKGKSLLNIDNFDAQVILVLSPEGSVEDVIDSSGKNKQLLIHKAIIENFEEEIFVTDRKGRILLVNPKGEEIMGMPAAEMEGRLVEELVEKQVFSISGASEVLRQKKKIHVMQQMKKGSRWRLCTGVPVLNRQGDIMLTLCTSKDMTELVELKKQLETKEDELKRKNAELGHMQDELFAQVNFISKSPEMREVKETVQKIAPLNLTVLIQGDTGVGKEVVARAIHALSPRRDAAFVKINCSTLSDTLIESELFGYEGGAFTGADSKGRKGKIELAHGGTLFLDEIGEISPSTQVKLLEFLQDKELFRIGGTKKIKVNTRIIAATNRILHDEVEEGRFRKDLFYRLNLFPIMLPPLRQRREDIPALITYFLEQYNRKYNKNIVFDEQVVKEFLKHEWPGNVRELEHMVERAVVVYNDGMEICINDSVWDMLRGTYPKDEGVFCPEIIPYKQAKRELERQLVRKAYDMYGSTYKAAKVLEVDQSTVARILKRIREADQQN